MFPLDRVACYLRNSFNDVIRVSFNMAANKRFRTTFKEREILLKKYDQFPPMSQRAAARLLNISPSLLCVWLRHRKLSKTTIAPNKTELVEAALWGWMDSSHEKGIIPTEIMIRSKACELAKTMDFPDFRADKDWFRRFVHRERIIRKRFKLGWQEDDGQNISPEQPRCVAIPISNQSSSASIDKKRNACKRTEDGRVISYEVVERSENDSESDHMDALIQSDDMSVEEERTELDIPKLEPSVVTAELDGTSHTVIVPSLWQMKEAMKTLSTGLLYRGFCDFKLLHQFEKEVDNVLRRSLSLRTQHSFQD